MSHLFDNQKLLILGATSSEVSLVKRAQELGIYVITTDHNTDHVLSPAKDYSDEFWDISWSDVDALEKKCVEHRVDGITAGYSEFRIENLIKLCSRLRKPCYCTMEQLDVTRDKVKFKNLCRKYGVPVVHEYGCAADVDRYPVIVKPVDRAGSIGISIATNREELERAVAYATAMSVSQKIIIEDFIDCGTKFDVYYGVEEGKIEELSVCDTINAEANGYEKIVQSCWLYPSRNKKVFHEKVDGLLRNMISGLGIDYGCIFFSGFVKNDGAFVFFECGFRLEGAHQYEYVARKGPYDFNDIFIAHALTGSTNQIDRKTDINANLKCVDVNVYAKAGVISEIHGLDSIGRIDDLTLLIARAYIGKKCSGDSAILEKICQFAFCSESPEALKDHVDQAYLELKVLDSDGNDMIYDRVNTDKIATWW